MAAAFIVRGLTSFGAGNVKVLSSVIFKTYPTKILMYSPWNVHCLWNNAAQKEIILLASPIHEYSADTPRLKFLLDLIGKNSPRITKTSLVVDQYPAKFGFEYTYSYGKTGEYSFEFHKEDAWSYETTESSTPLDLRRSRLLRDARWGTEATNIAPPTSQ